MPTLSTDPEKAETTAQSGYDPATATTATATDIGRVRTINQDDFGEFQDATTGRRLLLVADGLGGHRGGEVASRIAVRRVREVFERIPDSDPEDLLSEAFAEANLGVFERASGDVELAGMGTTAVALLLTTDKGALLAHVGDSRGYRLRDGQLRQLTADHSVVGELVRRGQLSPEEARLHPQSNEILRALGTRPEVEVELTPVDARPGDRFLLCSDGLSGMLSDGQIAASLAEGSAQQIAEQLIELANEAGGMDNVTVQVVILPDTKSEAETTVTALDIRSSGAAAGPWLRWAIALALLLGIVVLVLLGGLDSDASH